MTRHHVKLGKLSIVYSSLALFVLGTVQSNSFAQATSEPAQGWDAVEAGFVNFLARSNPALRQPPAIQIVSPPLDLDHKGAEELRGILVQTADTIPEWGPYFRASGRTVREEFQAFVSSIEIPGPWPGGTRPGVPKDTTAFAFSPDVAKMVLGESFVQPERVEWKVMSSSGSQDTRTSSAKIRLRIGRAGIKGSASGKQQEFDSQLTEGVFSFTGVSTVSVIPGRWFSNRIIESSIKGPFKPGSGPEDWWGPKGRFSLYPKSLVIVSDPSFTLRLDTRSYQEVRRAFEAGATIGVGPFEIIAGDRAKISFDEKQLTISVRQTSKAMLIAVINRVNNSP